MTHKLRKPHRWTIFVVDKKRLNSQLKGFLLQQLQVKIQPNAITHMTPPPQSSTELDWQTNDCP